MENNPYGYDKSKIWPMSQNQPYTTNYPGASMNQQPGAPQAVRTAQTRDGRIRKPAPVRMPKDKALALAGLFKRALVVISLATFASFSGLVAYHQVSTASASTSTTTSSSEHKHHTFFNQQGDDNLGESTPTATATSNDSNNAATPTTGSSGGSIFNPPSGPASGSQTS